MTSTLSNASPPKGAGALKKKKSKKPSSSENILAATGGSEIAATLLGDKLTDSANGSQVGKEKVEKEYIKEVSKRLKKQSRKMADIGRTEEKIKGLTEEEQAITRLINKDERSKMEAKPITSAVWNELSEIHEILKKVADAEDKRIEKEKTEAETKFNNAVAEAREEGKKIGAEEVTANISTLVRFLRLAGYRRQFKSGNDQEDEAIEKLLVLVYGGDQTAVDACLKLANGSDDVIDDFGVTFGQIKETAHSLKLPGEEEQTEEADAEVEAAAEPETVETTAGDIELTAQEGEADEPPPYTALIEAAEESTPPPQALTNGDTEIPVTVPATSLTADDAANEEAKTIEHVEAASEVIPTEVTSNETAESAIPATATDVPPSTRADWDEEVKASEPAPPAVPETKEGEFQSVGRHRGGRGDFRGRGGDYRGRGRGGGYRGRGEYRGRGDGEYRGRGDREYRPRGDGEYRGRGDGEHRSRGDGEYRGRGDGEHRPRGNGEYRGRGDGEGYRGRGAYRNRERGDGEHRGGYRGRGQHHQGPRPQQQPPQQQGSDKEAAKVPAQEPAQEPVQAPVQAQSAPIST